MKNFDRNRFEQMSVAERGMMLISEGKHLAQIKRGDYLLNLYSLRDLFVEVHYSLLINRIEKINILSDFTKIDYYIEEKQKVKKINLN